MDEPPAKKAREDVVSSSRESSDCCFPVPTGSPTMKKIGKGYVPHNTEKATGWALRVFNAWRQERNRSSTDKCPDDLLECPDVGSLNRWLSRFVVECRREDGNPYPPSSITKSYASDPGSCPNFMNRKDSNFCDLNGAIQVRFRELREKGVGAEVKHASVVLPEEEDMLWASKVIGNHCPLALQRAVFFYVGKSFCLRGGEEQRRLKHSQFKRSFDPDCYTYIENGSKNYTGVNAVENKVVPVYATPESKPRCLVFLLDKYFDKFLSDSRGVDAFHLRPKASYTSDVWYDCVPVGAHKLNKYLECMCQEAGIQGKKTNHSLRATGASAMFNAGVPEKLIRSVTGHRSNALQLYERPTNEQLQETSAVLLQGKRKFSPGKENETSTGNVTTAAPTSQTIVPTASLAGAQTPMAAAPAHLPTSGCFGSIFSGVTNITVNVSQVSSNHNSPELGGLLNGLDLDQFLQF